MSDRILLTEGQDALDDIEAHLAETRQRDSQLEGSLNQMLAKKICEAQKRKRINEHLESLARGVLKPR